MVKLFKDGDSMAIQTNAPDERTFIQEFAATLAELIDKKVFISDDDVVASDWEFQLNGWLPPFVEICCKLRGYKSAAHEQRVITSGVLNPNNNDLVIEVDEKGNFLRRAKEGNGVVAR